MRSPCGEKIRVRNEPLDGRNTLTSKEMVKVKNLFPRKEKGHVKKKIQFGGYRVRKRELDD